MAGGTVKYRHLSRNSAARKALLRGLVTQLIEHEHILTTRAKAKEAQRLAEKLITLAKRGNEPCRRSAQGILYVRLTLVAPALPPLAAANHFLFNFLMLAWFWRPGHGAGAAEARGRMCTCACVPGSAISLMRI